MFNRIILFCLSLILSGCALIDVMVSDDPVKGLVGDLQPRKQSPEYGSQIVNGQEVLNSDKVHKYAVLLTVERQGKTTSCTAVPITKSVLLTAAHCVHGAKPSAVKAFFDSSHTFALDYKTHEKYEGTPQSKSDLALVKLHSPLGYGYEPMALYDGTSERENDDVILLGFGITDEKKSDGLTLRTTSKSFKNDVYIKEGLMGFNQKNKTGGFQRGLWSAHLRDFGR
jgi:Trypsin